MNNITAIESLEDWDEKIEKSEEMLLGACLPRARETVLYWLSQ